MGLPKGKWQEHVKKSIETGRRPEPGENKKAVLWCLVCLKKQTTQNATEHLDVINLTLYSWKGDHTEQLFIGSF